MNAPSASVVAVATVGPARLSACSMTVTPGRACPGSMTLVSLSRSLTTTPEIFVSCLLTMKFRMSLSALPWMSTVSARLKPFRTVQTVSPALVTESMTDTRNVPSRMPVSVNMPLESDVTVVSVGHGFRFGSIAWTRTFAPAAAVESTDFTRPVM